MFWDLFLSVIGILDIIARSSTWLRPLQSKEKLNQNGHFSICQMLDLNVSTRQQFNCWNARLAKNRQDVFNWPIHTKPNHFVRSYDFYMPYVSVLFKITLLQNTLVSKCQLHKCIFVSCGQAWDVPHFWINV